MPKKPETKSSIRREAHCRSCGGQFDLYLMIDDTCTLCLHKAAAKMQEMNAENAKAEKVRTCAPLGPRGMLPSTSTWRYV